MAKKNNPTGLSTGQGKGAAQVFGSTYNPYFKERLTEAKKKDKEVTDAMAKVSDTSQLWSRDVGVFKPMVNDLQQFYRDNARAIIKGDFDATLKLKQMQNEMAQYVTSSKDAQKYANEMLKLVNKPGSNYTDDSRQKIFDFVNQAQAGNFDTSGLILNEKYDAADTLKAMTDEISKIKYDYDTPVVKTIGGKKVMINKGVQSTEGIESIVDSYIDKDIKLYGEEARKYYTPERRQELIDKGVAAAGSTQQAYGFTDYTQPRPTQRGQEKIEAANRRNILLGTVHYDKDTDKANAELSNLVNQLNKAYGKQQIIKAVRETPKENPRLATTSVVITMSNGKQKVIPLGVGFENQLNSFINNTGVENVITNEERVSGIPYTKPKDYLEVQEGNQGVHDWKFAFKKMAAFSKGIKNIFTDLDGSATSQWIGGFASSENQAKMKEVKGSLSSSNEDTREEAWSDLLTESWSGANHNGKSISSVKAESASGSSDYITITYSDGTTSAEIKTNSNGFTNLLKGLGSKTLKPLPPLEFPPKP